MFHRLSHQRFAAPALFYDSRLEADLLELAREGWNAVIVTLYMPGNRYGIVFLLSYACALNQTWLFFKFSTRSNSYFPMCGRVVL